MIVRVVRWRHEEGAVDDQLTAAVEQVEVQARIEDQLLGAGGLACVAEGEQRRREALAPDFALQQSRRLQRDVAAFQRAVKEKTLEALDDLVTAARKTKWQALPEALGPLAQYAAPECLDAIATPGVSTDAAFVVLQSLVSRMEEMATGPYSVEHDQSKNLLTYHDLLQRYINHDQTIEFRQSEIARIKFPLKLVSVTQGAVVPYIHNAAADGLGKIGVLVALESTADKGALEALGKQLAMHIAAAFPQALDADGLDADVIEDLDDLAGKAALREQRRALHEQDDVIAGDKIGDTGIGVGHGALRP